MTPRHSRILLIASLSALALLTWGRVALVDNLHDQGFFAKYMDFADRILSGNPPRDRISDVSPVYLWLIVLFRAAGMSLGAIRATQIVALSLAVLLAAIAAKRLGGWVAALIAAVLILGNRAALVTATEVEPETLILLLNAAALAMLGNEKRGTRNEANPLGPRFPFLVPGFLLGLAAASRPTALVTLVLIVLWMAWRSRRMAIALASAALVPIIVFLLVNRAFGGGAAVMGPGTVFYEAYNPLAAGGAGVPPRIVADMNVASEEPDYLHVAYRVIAARATGRTVDANRYWGGKALAYIRTYPLDALELLAWKCVLAVHHYDVYDLVTMKRKADELARWPAIPFGVSFVLALVAVALRGGRRRELVPTLLFAIAIFVALLAFTVTSRQRNALLAPLAVLGGVGAAEIVTLARQRRERSLIAFGALVILTPILGIEGPPMREDAYNWLTSLRGDGMRKAAIDAHRRGDRPRAAALAAAASIDRVDQPPLVSPPTLIAVALDTAKDTESPPRLFDSAIALQKAGAWAQSEVVLRAIKDYRPRRENRAVSSVSYYRARAALHIRAPLPIVRALLDRAIGEAPGDPDVLALRSLLGDPRALARLDAMHDPFTRDAAVGRARALVALERRLPGGRSAGILPAVPRWPTETAGWKPAERPAGSQRSAKGGGIVPAPTPPRSGGSSGA